MIWVKQSFGENDLWRYEKIKYHDYKKFLDTEVGMGRNNPFIKIIPAPKLIVFYKKVIEILQNKYVDRIIFIIIGYFFKIFLDKLFQ